MTLFKIFLPTVHRQQKDDKSINSRIFIDKPSKKPWLTPNFSYRIFDQKASLEIPSIRINYGRSVTGYVATNCPAEIAIFSLHRILQEAEEEREAIFYSMFHHSNFIFFWRRSCGKEEGIVGTTSICTRRLKRKL